MFAAQSGSLAEDSEGQQHTFLAAQSAACWHSTPWTGDICLKQQASPLARVETRETVTTTHQAARQGQEETLAQAV